MLISHYRLQAIGHLEKSIQKTLAEKHDFSRLFWAKFSGNDIMDIGHTWRNNMERNLNHFYSMRLREIESIYEKIGIGLPNERDLLTRWQRDSASESQNATFILETSNSNIREDANAKLA